MNTGLPRASVDVFVELQATWNKPYLIKQVIWLCIQHYVLFSFILSFAYLLMYCLFKHSPLISTVI